MKPLSRTTVAYMDARGLSVDPEKRVLPEDDLVAFLQKYYPVSEVWDYDVREYIILLTDCLLAMDERLYHQYRPVTDLFRKIIYTVSPSANTEDSVWKTAIQKGDALGLIDPRDLTMMPHLHKEVLA